MITIIDYGCGNINAFVNVFKRLNISSKIARSAGDLENCEKIILPGVGAFDHVMTQFNTSGMREHVEKKVLEENIPVLGICAGMQILANGSEEGTESGLGWIDGDVKKFDVTGIRYKTKLPHMGWNEITHNGNPLFRAIEPSSRFYFVHSYYFLCYSNDDSIAQTEYGCTFTSAVNRKNIYGVQFHPEKSHENGHQLLKNFAML
jgi:imidazole glycerol-phosphate synthase subunit HisH